MILVLGLGNSLLRDEGIGVRVAEEMTDLGPDVEVRNGATLGMGLFDLIKGYEKTIIVDAVDMGKAPGTLARFTAEKVLGLPELRSFSLHEFGLLEVLKLGQSLGEDFKNVIIIGVQPKEVQRSEFLSSEVEAAIPEIVKMIKQEVSYAGSFT